ncbi:F-actin-capping protein subunit alpha [Cryptotrichosporon argae]
MADLSLDDRCKLAAKLIAQSPPGEVNDVINDIRAIIGDDDALMPHVRPALRAYNLAQLHVVEHAAADGVDAHVSVLSEATRVPGSSADRHVDAGSARSFAFDHLTFAVSDYAPHRLPPDEESFRAELAASLAKYAKNHFPAGAASVACSQFALVEAAPAQPAAQSMSVMKGDEAPGTAPAADTADAEAVTDVVPELPAAGEAEPAPTPAVADVPKTGVDEVVKPEDLSRLDEAVEQEKEKEEQEDKEQAGEKEKVEKEGEGAVESNDAKETEVLAPEPVVEESEAPVPAVQESGTPSRVVEDSEASASAIEESEPAAKQERVDNPVYTLEIVGNKYNPNNFWTGRWRTRWVVDPAKRVVDGTITVDVHYYEQGNVQLASRHAASFPLPVAGGQSVASQVVSTIARIETAYQHELNKVYGDLGDKAFRTLRRALPVTRQKVDWDKVGGYTLGADLSKART